MPEPIKPAGAASSPAPPGLTPCPLSDQQQLSKAASPAAAGTDAVVCERCGGSNVYRMHAVWRCADCGYKTDCCGW